jgi:hypothetical protein
VHTDIERREFLKRAAVVGGAGASLGAATLLGADPASAAQRCRFGALSLRMNDQRTGVRRLEYQMGRKFDTTHYRMPWTSPLVNDFTRWSAASGHTQILSWFARTKSGPVSWRGIAAGHNDGWITSQARHLRGTGWHGFLCFHKEPEDEGTPDDWKAAYNRVHRIFHRVGVTRFKWIVTLTAATYLKGEAGRWMPRHYDLLGVDGYNRYRCVGVPWRSFRQIFAPARTYAKAHGKQLYAIEVGCVEGEPGRKAAWIKNARSTIKSWPEMVGFSYNNENTDCSYYMDSSNSALTAFRNMGSDRYFR